jgi:hypothetical protein
MKTKEITRTKVNVVSKKGETVLVEYMQDGKSERKYIPANELGDGHVLDNVLHQGIPYGYPFEEIYLTFDSQKFANELHQVGVWTVEDTLKYPQKLWSALNATFADSISKILATALHEKRSKHHD